MPLLEEEELNELAKRFAEQIPEDEMSVSFSISFLVVSHVSGGDTQLNFLCFFRWQVFRVIC